MRKLLFNGKSIGRIAYKTKNIVIQLVQEGTNNDKCYIIGTGYSLSVDDNDLVSSHDPFMDKFNINIDRNITAYSFYFTFESSGLEESSRELADFINNLDNKYKEIYLIGQSKCGLCVYNASHYCNKEIILVTISAPFKGTPTADKDAVKNLLNNNSLRKIYNKIFSDHNVDRDIIPNSNFINSLKKPKYVKHINITSRLCKLSDCRRVSDLFLLLLDKMMKLNGDGVVPYESQKIESTETIDMISSHATSLKNGIKELEKIL